MNNQNKKLLDSYPKEQQAFVMNEWKNAMNWCNYISEGEKKRLREMLANGYSISGIEIETTKNK